MATRAQRLKKLVREGNALHEAWQKAVDESTNRNSVLSEDEDENARLHYELDEKVENAAYQLELWAQDNVPAIYSLTMGVLSGG